MASCTGKIGPKLLRRLGGTHEFIGQKTSWAHMKEETFIEILAFRKCKNFEISLRYLNLKLRGNVKNREKLE